MLRLRRRSSVCTAVAVALLILSDVANAQTPSQPDRCLYQSDSHTAFGLLARSSGTRHAGQGETAVGALLSAWAAGRGMTLGPCTLGTTHRFDLGIGAGAIPRSASIALEFDAGWGPRLRLHASPDGTHALVARGGVRVRADIDRVFGYGSLSLPQVELGYAAYGPDWLFDATLHASFVVEAGFSSRYLHGDAVESDGVERRHLPRALGARIALASQPILLEALYEDIRQTRSDGPVFKTGEGRLCATASSLVLCTVARVHQISWAGPRLQTVGSGDDFGGRQAWIDSGTVRWGWSTGLMIGLGLGGTSRK
ncbi:MAG: hypothetical protein HY898_21930 [Deltaproteobacteria bacterium]|nr:hypothetical protein [Deltaproteobacteria bacterium]